MTGRNKHGEHTRVILDLTKTIVDVTSFFQQASDSLP